MDKNERSCPLRFPINLRGGSSLWPLIEMVRRFEVMMLSRKLEEKANLVKSFTFIGLTYSYTVLNSKRMLEYLWSGLPMLQLWLRKAGVSQRMQDQISLR